MRGYMYDKLVVSPCLGFLLTTVQVPFTTVLYLCPFTKISRWATMPPQTYMYSKLCYFVPDMPTDLVLHELLTGLVQCPRLVRHKVVFLLHVSQVVQGLPHLRQHSSTLPTIVTQLAAVGSGGEHRKNKIAQCMQCMLLPEFSL